MKVQKKRPKFSKVSGARDRPRKKRPKIDSKSWMCVGIDLSMSSIAGAAISYDATLKELLGPKYIFKSWERNTHYFDRIQDLSRAENFIHELQAQLKIVNVPAEQIYIAIEEPFPMGMVKQLQSVSIKQSAELSGALLAGLLRWGFKNVFQVNVKSWQGVVAEELGVTTHFSKWNYKRNPFQLAPSGKGSGKWRAKEWALAKGAPDWPDIITSSKLGKIPRPETSRAVAVQPDDRYDALAVMEWMKRERETFT